jgi:6-phosphogluconolactonase
MTQISRRALMAGMAATPYLSAKDDLLVFVGTYTGPNSKGIYGWRFRNGSLTSLGNVGETASPSFLAVHPTGRFLYAANEGREGSVTGFSIDKATGKLTEINKASSQGGGSCYVSVDQTGKYVLVANYGGGSVTVLPIDEKGRLGDATAHVQHTGKSVDPKRQTKAFAHCVKLSPDNRFALVADLGMDQLLVYAFDPSKGTLKLHSEGKLKPGSGPRHFAFHPNKRMVYQINELNSTITSFAWDNGQLYERQVVSTLPEGFTGENYTAEIVVHPSGKWLYGSNRGHDSLARFSIDGSGRLALVDHTPTKGSTPRNFALDPSAKWLFAANQRSNNIVVFDVNQKDGKLTDTGKVLEVSAPVCVRFLSV